MIICIGEIVWDIFGAKKALGGAPLNVAYHLNEMGLDVQFISRVGQDEYGREAIQRIKNLDLSLDSMQHDAKYQTGKVLVHLNNDNEPSFEIISPAAWDFIDRAQISLHQGTPFHLVFGTLAQRAAKSRETIRSLIPLAETVFYDVNLRPPYTTPDLVLDSLPLANVAKMNENELAAIQGWSDLPPGNMEEMAKSLLNKFRLDVLAVTLGKEGAILVCRDGVYKHKGFPATIADTVGAGDAFFAALISGILQKHAWQECLVQANKRGAYVASLHGAIPDLKPAKNNFNRG